MKIALRGVALLVALCCLFSSCGESGVKDPLAEEGTTAAETENTPNAMIDSLTRDSEVVYADDDDDSIVTMYLTVSTGNSSDNTNHTWTEVNAHSTYYYQENNLEKFGVEGLLQVGDETGPLNGQFGFTDFAPNCTVTIRGQTSTRSPQKSYKINIKKNKGTWREQRVINLNKHVYDSVRFRNKMSYDLLKTIPGAFSVRTQFVHLYVRDMTPGGSGQFEDYGLYTHAEQINKSYLRNHGLDENGQLYKAAMFEFMRYDDNIKLTTDPDYDQSAFEEILEIKGDDDHSKLIEMLNAVNNYAVPIEEVLPKYFDLDNYFTWFAFQIITGNTDTNSQNFYLYSPRNSNKWYFISWDNDGAWEYYEETAIDGEPSGYRYNVGVSNYWGVILHQRVLKSDVYRKMLDDKIQELRQLLTKERLTQMVNTYSALVRPFLFGQPDYNYSPLVEEEFNAVIAEIPNEIDYRYELYKASLESPMPFYVDDPIMLNGQLTFGWEASYDFDDEAVTYKFELADNYQFNNPISVQENLITPQAFCNALPAGQYFFRVSCQNESGYTQTAMADYEAEDEATYYGVICFYINADGSIVRG